MDDQLISIYFTVAEYYSALVAVVKDLPDSKLSTAAAICSAVAAISSVYIARRSYKLSVSVIDKDYNKGLLEEAQLLLEHAYNMLTNDGKNIDPPLANRTNWLASARYIEQYKDFKSRITDETHRLICDRKEEYWRHKFHLVLDQPHFDQKTYYNGGSPKDFTKSIEPRSAVVIHAFSMWNEQEIDPIEHVNIKEITSNRKLFNRRPGLETFLNDEMK